MISFRFKNICIHVYFFRLSFTIAWFIHFFLPSCSGQKWNNWKKVNLLLKLTFCVKVNRSHQRYRNKKDKIHKTRAAILFCFCMHSHGVWLWIVWAGCTFECCHNTWRRCSWSAASLEVRTSQDNCTVLSTYNWLFYLSTFCLLKLILKISQLWSELELILIEEHYWECPHTTQCTELHQWSMQSAVLLLSAGFLQHNTVCSALCGTSAGTQQCPNKETVTATTEEHQELLKHDCTFHKVQHSHLSMKEGNTPALYFGTMFCHCSQNSHADVFKIPYIIANYYSYRTNCFKY